MSAVKSAISPRSYADSDTFAAELRSVFRDSWICVAMRKDFARHNDYVVRDIGGLSIVLQNTDGVVRAFHNVCSHRHSPIQVGHCGNRALVCPFHGWTYDSVGLPVGVPANKEGFGLTATDRIALKLVEFPVRWCGSFAFVRLSGDDSGLDTFLGPAAMWLRELDGKIDQPIAGDQDTWDCNWKLGVEIALEGYHLDSVHGESFKPLLHKDGSSIECIDKHSVQKTLYKPEVQQWWRTITRRAELNPIADDGSYRHAFIFPNLAVGITCGALTSIQTYWPLTPTTCRVDFAEYFALKDNPSDTARAIRSGLIGHFAELNAKILAEDRSAVERVQRSVSQLDQPAVLGTMERRIASFHCELGRMLNSKPPTTPSAPLSSLDNA